MNAGGVRLPLLSGNDLQDSIFEGLFSTTRVGDGPLSPAPTSTFRRITVNKIVSLLKLLHLGQLRITMAATGTLVDLSPETPTHGSPLLYDTELPWTRILDSELQISPVIKGPGRTSIFSTSPLSPTLEDDDTPSKNPCSGACTFETGHCG